MLAGSQPGGPESLLSVGRKLVSEGWTPLQGFEQERVLWEQRSTSGDVLQRAKAKERLAEATCGRNREALQQVYTAMVSRGTTAKNVSELPIRAEYLEDPLGVGFLIVNGRVVAPGYEAANAERDVRVLFRGWQRAHPGETPTEADFPEIKARLRPYLRLVVTPDRLEVEGFLPE